MAGDGLRMAVAQVPVSSALPTAEVIRTGGEVVRSALVAAAREGARLVQFPEGTLTYPGKRVISSMSPELGEADWSKLDWLTLRAELEAISVCCAELAVWAVVGAPHRLSGSRRPHNSLYVFSAAGEVVTRYDKRRLSMNEARFLYTPGVAPVVFEVDGYRFGLTLCLEALFPELFVEYAALGVDAVLLSSAPDEGFMTLARAHAHMNAMSVATAFAAGDASQGHRSGICTMFGWVARSTDALPGMVIGEIPRIPDEPSFHRQARTGLYDGLFASDDPRSTDRTSL